MSTFAVKAAIVVLVLAGGAGLKVVRYGPGAQTGSPLAHATQIMTAHGWHEATDGPDAASTLHEQRIYVRPGCKGPVIVAALAGNAEGAQFFRLQNGGNVAFIQNDIVAQPSGFQRQFSGLASGLKRMLGLDAGPPLTVIGVAPAPVAQPGACDGPPRSAWLRRSSD